MTTFSILIPFRDKIPLLQECLNTLKKALGDSINCSEVLLLNNGSQKSELDTLQIPAGLNAKMIDLDIPFHFQKIMNIAAAKAQGKFLLLLNNDIVFTKKSYNFLNVMHRYAAQKEIGAVGPLLYYPDQRIQHAGVVIGLNDLCCHLYPRWTTRESRRLPYKRYNENRFVSAVTGACLMIEKSKFDAIGGLDERFIVYGGDTDLCLRLHAEGFQNYYLGTVSMIHKETQTINLNDLPSYPSDLVEMKRSYGEFLARHNGRDPYYPHPLPLHIAPPPPRFWEKVLNKIFGP